MAWPTTLAPTISLLRMSMSVRTASPCLLAVRWRVVIRSLKGGRGLLCSSLTTMALHQTKDLQTPWASKRTSPCQAVLSCLRCISNMRTKFDETKRWGGGRVSIIICGRWYVRCFLCCCYCSVTFILDRLFDDWLIFYLVHSLVDNICRCICCCPTTLVEHWID